MMRAQVDEIPAFAQAMKATTPTSPPLHSTRALLLPEHVALEPLSRQLKHGTKEVHAAAEKTEFVREFIKGRCPRWVYAAMLKDLYFVYAANPTLATLTLPLTISLTLSRYAALEAAALAASSPGTAHAKFHGFHAAFDKQLARAPLLDADLAHLLGPGWKAAAEGRPSPAAERYVARLRTLGDTRPELLVAHTYTRYLGDLSGGRVLLRIARKLLQLGPDEQGGVSFYIFDKVDSDTDRDVMSRKTNPIRIERLHTH